MLRDKLLMRRRRIGADPDDLGPQRANLLDMVAEAARLGRTSGRHVLGIKIEHDCAARAQVLQRDLVALLVGQREGWRLPALESLRIALAAGGGRLCTLRHRDPRVCARSSKRRACISSQLRRLWRKAARRSTAAAWCRLGEPSVVA